MLHAGFAECPLPGVQSVSGAVMACALEACLLGLPQVRALHVIRSVFAGPLVVAIRPLPARSFDATPDPSDLPAKYKDNLPAFMTWYYREQIRVISGVAKSIGAVCLPPPEEFLRAGFTPERFCPYEPWHANADYGEIMLHAALQLIRQTSSA